MLLGVTRQALTNLVNEKAGISQGDVPYGFRKRSAAAPSLGCR